MNNTIYVKRFDTTAMCDVTEDVVLPDYIPEVRRVIGVRATVSADGKYLSGDELETDGGVTYNVLYIGGDGALCSTSQTTSYTGHVPLRTDGAEDDRFTTQDIVLSCTVESVNCRVTAPRRLTLSSKVRQRVLSQKPIDVTMKTDGTFPVRRRTEERSCAVMSEYRQTGECSGELREREGMKVICANGELCLSDTRLTENGGAVRIKGDAYVTAVLLSPEGQYVTSRSRVAVEEELSLPELHNVSSCSAAAFGEVVLLELTVGEGGVIVWHMEYDLDCCVIKRTKAVVVTDAYLAGCADETEVSTHEAVCPAFAVNGRLTTQTSVKLKPGMAYVCAWGRGTVERLEVANGRGVVGGNVVISVACAGGGEAILEEVTLPFRYECDIGGDASSVPLGGKVALRVTDIQARGDGEQLGLTAELAISAAVLGTEVVSCVASIAPSGDGEGTTASTAENVIRIYVPDEGETAWDVEKRFRLGREARSDGNIYVVG